MQAQPSTESQVQADCSIAVPGSSPMEVAMCCRLFLDRELPANVSRLPLGSDATRKERVAATVFVDFLPLRVEVCTHVAPDGVTCVSLAHSSRSDVVRFKHVADRLVAFLRSSGLRPSIALDTDSSLHKPGLLEDDFLEQIPTDDDGSSWFTRVERVMADLDSPRAHIREDAVQSLARWGRSATASHVALAHGFGGRAEKLARVFFGRPQAPVAEMYPLASALRCVACGECAEAQMILGESPLAEVMESYKQLLAGLPPLVARELSSVKLPRQSASAKERPPAYASESSDFTCCPDDGSLRVSEDGSLRVFDDDSRDHCGPRDDSRSRSPYGVEERHAAEAKEP